MYGEREEGQLGEKTLRLKKSRASAAVTDLHTQTHKLFWAPCAKLALPKLRS